MSELLPCPFCGGEAKTRLNDRWWVHCGNCTCEIGFEGMDENGYYGHFDTEAEAIAAWNTRAERTCKPLGTIRYDYEGGYAGFEYETELSCGHKWRDAYGDYPDYCPKCGAKVVEE